MKHAALAYMKNTLENIYYLIRLIVKYVQFSQHLYKAP